MHERKAMLITVSLFNPDFLLKRLNTVSFKRELQVVDDTVNTRISYAKPHDYIDRGVARRGSRNQDPQPRPDNPRDSCKFDGLWGE